MVMGEGFREDQRAINRWRDELFAPLDAAVARMDEVPFIDQRQEALEIERMDAARLEEVLAAHDNAVIHPPPEDEPRTITLPAGVERLRRNMVILRP